ncbi:MAG: peptidoglycan hydrolase FlgJ [Clostridiales bacterium]|nr:peptidoglycan hydrolase FlgJ [Clostridiales bacterium]
MSLSIDTASLYQNVQTTSSDTTGKTDSLKSTLSGLDMQNATDKELLDACKSFETYFTEQVIKEMKKTVHSSDDDSDYMQSFGDILTEGYAQNITDSGSLGIAQMLYESMKNR